MEVAPVPGGGAGEEDGGGADRISNLPDDNLRHIISLLPTKEAARTRILASRWRPLWCSAPLNLDCRDLTADNAAYAGMVATTLSSHRGPVRRFCVDANLLADPPGATDAWFRSAAFDNLEELEFSSNQHSPPAMSIFRFSPTLRAVTVEKTVLADAVFHGLHFPVLKHLGLSEVAISEMSLHSLIAGCSALEHLLISNCMGVNCVRINSLSLVSVGARLTGLRRPMCPLLLGKIVVENAPRLERLLLLNSGTRLHVTVVSAPKLETLGYLNDEHYYSGFSRLVLGSTVIQGLRIVDEQLVTVVRTVKTLSLNMDTLSLDRVIQLMRCFPCLEKLYIRLPKSGPSNLWRRKHRDLIKCLDIRLKTIVLGSYLGNKTQLNFATFFVLNARVLESMTLEYYADSRLDDKEFLSKQFRDLQLESRASRGAKFYLTTNKSIRNHWEFNHVRDLDLADPFACE
ncbi:putative F-box/LRR-repeat protein At5g02700 [Lolium rigidum]|uniref:putative F-box/LRR-repeat protein At5g02700 n=1 Tax=Lolium rigidum TaxID=89674 RepID=UPI001F5C4251|nr:putative F-box/LRR-repeat protein At5g02700 [Lolium rigidum]